MAHDTRLLACLLLTVTLGSQWRVDMDLRITSNHFLLDPTRWPDKSSWASAADGAVIYGESYKGWIADHSEINAFYFEHSWIQWNRFHFYLPNDYSLTDFHDRIGPALQLVGTELTYVENGTSIFVTYDSTETQISGAVACADFRVFHGDIVINDEPLEVDIAILSSRAHVRVTGRQSPVSQGFLTFGIGNGGTIFDAWYLNGAGTDLTDQYYENGELNQDSTQNLEDVEVGGVVTTDESPGRRFSFWRDRVASDTTHDLDFPCTETLQVVQAWVSADRIGADWDNDDDPSHPTQNWISTLNMTKLHTVVVDGRTPAPTFDFDVTLRDQQYMHFVFMILAFVVCIPCGAITSNYREVIFGPGTKLRKACGNSTDAWLWTHIFFMFFGAIFAFIGMITGIVMAEKPLFETNHSKYGVATLIMFSFQFLSGLMRPKEYLSWKTQKVGWLRWTYNWVHWANGYSLLVVSFLAMWYGALQENILFPLIDANTVTALGYTLFFIFFCERVDRYLVKRLRQGNY